MRQPFTTKAIAECVGSGGVREAEANIELLRIVSAASAADWDVKFTIKRVHPMYFASRGNA